MADHARTLSILASASTHVASFDRQATDSKWSLPGSRPTTLKEAMDWLCIPRKVNRRYDCIFLSSPSSSDAYCQPSHSPMAALAIRSYTVLSTGRLPYTAGALRPVSRVDQQEFVFHETRYYHLIRSRYTRAIARLQQHRYLSFPKQMLPLRRAAPHSLQQCSSSVIVRSSVCEYAPINTGWAQGIMVRK